MKKNLQISIEMLSVYSLVLLMFTILLASISTQASVAISQQLYFQLLANAQDFSSRIQRAYSYGNGYKESFYFPAEVGFIPFNLTITGPGIITASAKYGNKVLSAYAFSGVQSYYLDPYYAIPNGYSVPIAAGIINIVNSNGLICINSQTCPAYKIPKYISIYATNSTASLSNNVTIIAKVIDQFGNPIPYPWVGFSTTLGIFSNNKQTQFVKGDGMGIAKVTLKTNSQKGIAKVIATAFNGNSSIISNLTAWFPLNENQQNIIFDVKSNNNGNAYNIAWLSATPISASSFNGVNAYIQTPSIAPSSITITGWIKFNSNKNWMIYCHGVGGNAGTYYLYGNETGGTSARDIDMTVFASNGTRYDAMVTNYNFNLGQWYFVAGSFDASSRNLSTFVNGVKVASTPNAALGTQTIRGLIGTYEGGGYFVNGSIANVQIYSTALTPQQIQQLYSQGINSPPIPNAGLVGWWPLQGNANDYSSYNNNGIIYNTIFVPINVTQVSNLNVSSSPTINQFPVVGKFNGVNAYIDVGDFNLTPKNAFTVVAWVYWNSFSQSWSKIIDFGNGQANNNILFAHWGTTPDLVFELYNSNGASGGKIVASGALVTGQWLQLAATIDSSGNVVLYKNGVAIQTGKSAFPPASVVRTLNYIGRSNWAADGYFNGSIANVQIYSTALTPQQIQQLYSQGINSPPIPNAGLVGWWPLQGNANDYSSYGNNGTAYNVNFVRSNYSYLPIYQSSNKSGTSFNGVNAYIEIPDSVSLRPQNTITVEAFVKVSSATTTQNIVVKPYDNGYHGYGIWIYNGHYWFGITQAGPSDKTYDSGIAPSINTWEHVAMTYDNNYIKFYRNGVLTASYALTGNILYDTHPVTIGRYDGSFGQYFNGSIANVQIYNSSLTSQQIQQLYYAGIPPSNEVRIVLK